MTRRVNFRLLLLLALLTYGAIREVVKEQRPSLLRPGLRMYAYVANAGDGTVTVADLITLRARGSIAVGEAPSGIRAHPTRDEIWGVSTAGGHVWIIDAPSGQVVARIPVGRGAFALDFSPDGEHAYVAASDAHQVVAINCAARKVVGSTRTGKKPWQARVTPDGNTLLVPNRDDATLTLLDAKTLAHIGSIAVAAQPEQVAILPDSSKAFIAATKANQISVVDLKRRVLLANLPLPGPAAALILKPDGGELYVPSPQSHSVTVVNTWANEVTETLMVGSQPAGGALGNDAEFNNVMFYLSDADSNLVRPIRMAYRQMLPPITTGHRPGASVLTPGEELLLVVNQSSDDMAVIRTRTRDLLTLIPLGRHPRDLAIKVF